MLSYNFKPKETLTALNISPDLCSNCDTCKVKCPSGFDISTKIAAITPVMQVPDEFLT